MNSLWLAMALLAVDGGGLRFEGSVAVGGGWDASLLVAPGSASAGSPVASASAAGGAALDLSDSAFLYVGALLDGSTFSALPELDRTGAGAEASLVVDIAGPLALVVAPSASFSWYADPARSGTSLTGRVSLRYRASSWLSLRVGYAHVLRSATDPVYGFDLDRLVGEVELRLARATWLSLSAFGELGDGTFYRALPIASGTAASETAYEPYRAPSGTLGAGLALEQGLGGGLSLDVAAGIRRTTTPDGTWTGPAVSAGATWRWD